MEENGNGTLDGGRREESTYFLHFNFQSVNVWGKCSHYTSKEKEAGSETVYYRRMWFLKKMLHSHTHIYTQCTHPGITGLRLQNESHLMFK